MKHISKGNKSLIYDFVFFENKYLQKKHGFNKFLKKIMFLIQKHQYHT